MRDNLTRVYAVAAAEWRYLFRGGVLWKLNGAHLIAVGTVLLAAWPGVTFTFQAPPAALWRAYAGAELAFSAFVLLALAADLIGRDRKVRAAEWVSFGLSPPGPVLVGRFAASSLALAFMYAAALPVALLACAAYPVPLSRLALFAVVLAPHAAVLSFLGCAIGAAFAGRREETALRRRWIALCTAFVALVTALLLLAARGGTAFELVNPVSALRAFFPAAGEIPGPLPQLEPWAWTTWALCSALAPASASVAAARLLARSVREGQSPTGEKPLRVNLPNPGGGDP